MKKALSIVLSIAVMLSMCVGFSIVGSAESALPLQGSNPDIATESTLILGHDKEAEGGAPATYDAATDTVTLTGSGNGASFVKVDLASLAGKDIVMQFTHTGLSYGSSWGLRVRLTEEAPAGRFELINNANGIKYFDAAEAETVISATSIQNTTRDYMIFAEVQEDSTYTYHFFIDNVFQASIEGQPQPTAFRIDQMAAHSAFAPKVSNINVFEADGVDAFDAPVAENINLAVDASTIVNIVDKKGDAAYANGAITFDHRDAPVALNLTTKMGALADEYVVSFNVDMHEGWESNGIVLNVGEGAELKVVKNTDANSEIGGIFLNDQRICKGGDDWNGKSVRAWLASTPAGGDGVQIVAHIDGNNVDFYYAGVKVGSATATALSRTISIKTAASAWGDRVYVSNVKIQNGDALVPTAGSTTGSTGSTSGNTGSTSGNTGSTGSTSGNTGSTGNNGSSSSTNGSGDSTGTTQPTAPAKNPAGKDVNLATDDETVVTVTDKAGVAQFDKETATVDFPKHLDNPVSVKFDTKNRLGDRYVVLFTAAMSGGWESNGVRISWGDGATIGLVKGHATGGKIVINGQEVIYDGIRNALISGTADILAYVYPNATDATKNNVDIYLGVTKIATMESVTTGDIITIGSVTGAWGDRIKLSNIKIMNNPSLGPGAAADGEGDGDGEGDSGSAGDGVIVNGVDTSKKGTGKDIEILAPADPADSKKNLADITKLELPEGATLEEGVVTLKGGVDLTFDLSDIKATDDYIISFKMASLNWWPHEYMNITFGQTGSAKYVWTYKGNGKPNGATQDKNEFAGVSGGTATKNTMKIPNSTLDATDYVIYVTTSPETGKRRIFFFANNKPLLAVNEDGTESTLVIEDQDVLNPCLTFRSFAGSAQYQISNISAYVAEAPSYKEPKIDKVYTTPPVPNADAKNWADLKNPVLVGGGEVKEDGTIVAPGGEAPASSVSIPLTGLTKEDGYVISFMTTTCSYDDWQSLTVTFGQEGEKNQKFILRGSTAYSGVYLNGAETRIKAMAAKGSMTKIDIMVCKSVETGSRRIVVFQDGQACVLYNNNTQNYETKTAELIDPILTFAGGKNGTFEITNLKVYKLSDTKGWTGPNDGGSANTGNPSQAAGALAVTAAIALPVIFFARKKKED